MSEPKTCPPCGQYWDPSLADDLLRCGNKVRDYGTVFTVQTYYDWAEKARELVRRAAELEAELTLCREALDEAVGMLNAVDPNAGSAGKWTGETFMDIARESRMIAPEGSADEQASE